MNRLFQIYNRVSERVWLAALLAFIFILLFVIVCFADATFDSGDGLNHYRISRYSWLHPELFLDSWGKPFFTLISSPFSQFGLIGLNVFNILCAVLSSFFCVKIARLLKLKYSLLVVLFLCFAVIYFPTINSGLTEPFFGLVLILSVYLVFTQKFLLAAIVVSFLPYVRSEGYLMLPLFFVLFLLKRRLLTSLFLGSGSVVYTLVGAFYYKDILWIMNRNPYTGNNGDIYGRGELLHFVTSYSDIFGEPLTFFILCGFAALLYLLFRKRKFPEKGDNPMLAEEIFLIYGTALACFVAHSIFWWKGIVGSLGLIRVMAGIMPAAALIGLRGLNFILLPVKKQWIVAILLLISSYLIVRAPFVQYYYPFQMHPEQVVIKEVSDWIRTSEYKDQKIYYLHPFLSHSLGFDPYDHEKADELWGFWGYIKEWGIESVPKRSLLVWDAHYAANEGRLPLDTILSNPNFRLLKIFKPKEEFTTLGGAKFSVYVFSREKSVASQNVSREFYDFESGSVPEGKYKLSSDHIFQGKSSYHLTADKEFGWGIERALGEMSSLIQIRMQAKIFSTEDIHNVSFVMQIDDMSGKMLSWEKNDIRIEKCKNGEWKDFDANFAPSSSLLVKGNILKLYLWNPDHQALFIDNLEIKFQ